MALVVCCLVTGESLSGIAEELLNGRDFPFPDQAAYVE